MKEPDPEVVRAARAGDAAAFEQLVRRYQGEVWRLCVQLLRDEALADDATQEAFVRAYRFLPRYRGDSKFSTWLFSISRNCALDEVRRAGRRRRMRERLEAEPPRRSSDLGTGIEVREALEGLPMELREPVVFIDMFGCSYNEVAQILDLPVGTVKSRVHRGRGVLAAVLGEPEEGSAGGLS